MTVHDIILAVRKRLNDVQDIKRWSNEELIDSVNSALSDITTELNPFTAEWVIELIDGKSKYELPPYFYRLINVVVNGKTVREENIKGFEWVQKNLHAIEHEIVVTVDLHHLYIYPAIFNTKRVALEKQAKKEESFARKRELLAQRDLIARDQAIVTYNYEEQVAYVKDTINLPERFRDAIVYYVMHHAHQSPVREAGEQKSIYYLNLYREKIEKLRQQIYANKHSRRLRSPHIRI